MEPDKIKYVNGILIPSGEPLLPCSPGFIPVVEDDPFLSNVMFIDPSQVIE